jgi:beta-N-acetylhexosaminidase
VSIAAGAHARAAGAVLVCAVDGLSLTDAERTFFREVAPSGVTLFGRNIPGQYRDVAALTRELQDTRPAGAPSLVVAIDQEGGRVARIKAPELDPGPAQRLADGRHDAAGLAEVRSVAEGMGRALRAVGINVDFAPVADVLTEPTNTAIGDRVLGTEPEPATLRAGAFLDGLAAAGVAGCLKHFPGQGNAKVDTHHGGAVVDVPRELLERRELVPFQRLVARAPMVMISHCIYPALDTIEASRSERIMQGLLRATLGFRGVIVSDDMNMGAIPQDEKVWQEAIVEALVAGADMLLVCKHLERYRLAHEALTAAAARSAVCARRLEAAATSMYTLRRGLAGAAGA